MANSSTEKLNRIVLQQGQANEELVTPKLKARIKAVVKGINQLLQRRRQRFGENKRLIYQLARIRAECGHFAAWVAIARIEQNSFSRR